MTFLNKRTAGYRRMSFGLTCILAIVLLFITGVTYRHINETLRRVVKSPINLPVPLKAFPFHIEDWEGQDVPIPEVIQRVAKNDDYMNRLYKHSMANHQVGFYVAYSARPRTLLGHRPQVCYPASGWVHDVTQQVRVSTITERVIPCLLHRFHMPGPHGEIFVLNYYIVNGRITDDEHVFSGLGWRTPNIAGDPARYVAQVQISSVSESAVRSAASDLTEELLRFLPDEQGRVSVAQSADLFGSVPK